MADESVAGSGLMAAEGSAGKQDSGNAIEQACAGTHAMADECVAGSGLRAAEYVAGSGLVAVKLLSSAESNGSTLSLVSSLR